MVELEFELTAEENCVVCTHRRDWPVRVPLCARHRDKIYEYAADPAAVCADVPENFDREEAES